MKLAIDASRSIDRVQKTGVEVVSDALLRTLEATCPSDVEIKYYTPEYIPWLPREKQRILPFGRFWTIIHFSWALWKDQPDALFVPVHNLPSWLPKRVVRIIHDISSFRTPDAYALKERLLISRDVRRSRTACQNVIVPTEAVKQDLIQLAQFSPDKIIPTGWALDESTIPPEDGTIPDKTKPYILFIGRIEEKKNVCLLLEAFQLFQVTHPEWCLILAGKPGHGFEEIEPHLQAPGVTHLGYITNEEKWRLLRGASIMAIPSKEEGFSFPMLEAFYAGVPVVASDIPPLHDVGGDACIYVSPLDAQSIRDGFVQLLEESVQTEGRIILGRERLNLFHWKAIAEKVWGRFCDTLVYSSQYLTMSNPTELLHSPEAEQERNARPFREVGVVFLRNAERQLLMTRSHKFSQSWGGFGGGKEPGDESLAATAIRELREESGLSLSPESLTFILETPYDFGEGKVHFFEATIPSDTVLTVNEQEIAEVRWMSLSEALMVPVFPATDACLKRLDSCRNKENATE